MKYHALVLCLAGAFAGGADAAPKAAAKSSAQPVKARAAARPAPKLVRAAPVRLAMNTARPAPARPAANAPRPAPLRMARSAVRTAPVRLAQNTQPAPSAAPAPNGVVMQPNQRIRGNVNEWQRLYTVEERYYRTVLFPDLPDERYVAEQVARMTENNRREAAELRALAERARTAGWQNIAAVYDHMAGDHARSAEHTTTWLVNNNYAVPPEPTITLAADTDPHESVHHMIQHHERLFNEALERRRGERSSTVRGLHLMNATTAARHLSLLRMLDRDIEVLNRRTLSARLEWELNPTYVASNFNQLMTRIDEEESAIFRRTTVAETPAPEPVVVERIVERVVEKPVEVIVEKPVERIVERVVEKPVYIERIVYRDRPASGRVAGTRQTRPATRRRPAK